MSMSTEWELNKALELIRDLWEAIENGELDTEFFNLRARVRNISVYEQSED